MDIQKVDIQKINYSSYIRSHIISPIDEMNYLLNFYVIDYTIDN